MLALQAKENKMGRMKRLSQELDWQAEQLADKEALDFDSQNRIDPDWWRDQDAEMTRIELDQLEAQAEVQDLRIGDWV